MHIKVPFLAVLLVTLIQLATYALQHNAYSAKSADEVLLSDENKITEVQLIDLSGKTHETNNPEVIKKVRSYLGEVEYVRLRNDQTFYMPMRTMTLRLFDGENTDLIIPYGQEAFINHKVYRIKKGTLEGETIYKFFIEDENGEP